MTIIIKYKFNKFFHVDTHFHPFLYLATIPGGMPTDINMKAMASLGQFVVYFHSLLPEGASVM